MASEDYCIECEVLIQKPNIFGTFLGDSMQDKPVKFKSGWKCAKCAKR